MTGWDAVAVALLVGVWVFNLVAWYVRAMRHGVPGWAKVVVVPALSAATIGATVVVLWGLA